CFADPVYFGFGVKDSCRHWHRKSPFSFVHKDNSMKNFALIILVVLLAGCATQADIKMPAVSPVHATAFSHKTFSHTILYSQPQPGILMAGGEQQPLLPLDQAQVSVAAARILVDMPDYILEQLPATATWVEPGQSDYALTIKLIAHDKA